MRATTADLERRYAHFCPCSFLPNPPPFLRFSNLSAITGLYRQRLTIETLKMCAMVSTGTRGPSIISQEEEVEAVTDDSSSEMEEEK